MQSRKGSSIMAMVTEKINILTEVKLQHIAKERWESPNDLLILLAVDLQKKVANIA